MVEEAEGGNGTSSPRRCRVSVVPRWMATLDGIANEAPPPPRRKRSCGGAAEKAGGKHDAAGGRLGKAEGANVGGFLSTAFSSGISESRWPCTSATRGALWPASRLFSASSSGRRNVGKEDEKDGPPLFSPSQRRRRSFSFSSSSSSVLPPFCPTLPLLSSLFSPLHAATAAEEGGEKGTAPSAGRTGHASVSSPCRPSGLCGGGRREGGGRVHHRSLPRPLLPSDSPSSAEKPRLLWVVSPTSAGSGPSHAAAAAAGGERAASREV